MRLLLLAFLLVPQDGVQTGTSPCRPLDSDSDLLRPYAFRDAEFSWRLRPLGGRSVVKYEVSFPSALSVGPEENHTVRAKYWRPAEGGRGPAAVLIHWLGGSFDGLELLAHRLAENGVGALMVFLPHYGPRRAKDAEKRDEMLSISGERTALHFRQAVLDVRRAGDWLASRPEVDPGRIGIVGFSLGAVVGALAAGVDPNFSKSVLVIGGGDLASIVFHDSEATKEIRAELEKRGITIDRLREELRGIEPLTFAARVARGSVLMFNAEDDEIIPRSSVEKLHEALGRPRIEWFKGGHYAVVTQLGTILRKAAAFLKGPPRVRVLIAEARERLEVEVAGGFVLFKAGTDRELSRSDAALRAMASCPSGRIRIGADECEEGAVLLVPRATGALRVAGTAYHGSLLLVPSKEGRLHAINVVDLERYVMGVLGPEIGNAPFEARKAQAVCARTYAAVTLAERKSELFDLYADVRDQVYRGVAKDDACARAVEETAGEILVHRGAPFKTYYHSTCGGTTESVFEWRKEKEIEPLAGAACGWCDGAKWSAWSVRLTAAEIAQALREKLGGKAVSGVSVKSATKGGRVREVAVAVAGGEVAIAAPDFRAALGYDRFRSTKFDVKRDGDVFSFSGRGWGHGVGLCQVGATGMAGAGKGYREILKKYYPGSEIERR
ncbi:MAG: SpoIID/LytB domain-containing protein [Planctomycetes bacterium]|nr:SpoIID/LytB domain-containing protein [Planctomycetota bacterium]